MKEERQLSESTIETKLTKLRILRKCVNIWDTHAVKTYIAGSEWGNNYKSIMEYVYRDFCHFNGFEYEITKYPKETKIPYVPLEKDIDQLVAGFKNSKYAPMLQQCIGEGFKLVFMKCAECEASILPRDWFNNEGLCDACYLKRRSDRNVP